VAVGGGVSVKATIAVAVKVMVVVVEEYGMILINHVAWAKSINVRSWSQRYGFFISNTSFHFISFLQDQ